MKQLPAYMVSGIKQYDAGTGHEEAYYYDALDRLASYTVNGVTAASFTYDGTGNIVTHSRVGSYSYGDGVSIDYDAEGMRRHTRFFHGGVLQKAVTRISDLHEEKPQLRLQRLAHLD